MESGKLFYTIGEVAEMFKVNTSLIRFWETEFDVIKPQRNKKGNRLFTVSDVDYFHQIYHLVKEQGFTLQGAKDRLKTKTSDAANVNFEVVKTLKNIKTFLLDLKDNL
ncbi:MAG: MerR family transcriptional regulator [Bacteroidales bacterium]|jgi:DNA-binding transcriptional MerR regulator|nr:MerR family transcriptional regulator [Bacteroidales bacterium]